MAERFSLDLLLLLITLTIINLCLISAADPTLPPPPSLPPTILAPPPHSPSNTASPLPLAIPSTKHPTPPPPTTPPLHQSPLSTTTLSPPPPPSPSQIQEQLLNNIIDSLLTARNFAFWANLLSTANLSTLPIIATLFIPSNDAISHLPTATSATINFDPLLIPYHIVPHRLSFSDLQFFTPFSRLPTLLPSKTILITNNTLSNFTIDNSQIIHPDIYLTSSISVHGINTILDYTLYGDSFFPPPPPAEAITTIPQLNAPPRTVVPPFFPAGEVTGGGAGKSDAAACLCTEFLMSFSVICGVFVFKILQNPLNSLMGLFTR